MKASRLAKHPSILAYYVFEVSQNRPIFRPTLGLFLTECPNLKCTVKTNLLRRQFPQFMHSILYFRLLLTTIWPQSEIVTDCPCIIHQV